MCRAVFGRGLNRTGAVWVRFRDVAPGQEQARGEVSGRCLSAWSRFGSRDAVAWGRRNLPGRVQNPGTGLEGAVWVRFRNVALGQEQARGGVSGRCLSAWSRFGSRAAVAWGRRNLPGRVQIPEPVWGGSLGPVPECCPSAWNRREVKFRGGACPPGRGLGRGSPPG